MHQIAQILRYYTERPCKFPDRLYVDLLFKQNEQLSAGEQLLKPFQQLPQNKLICLKRLDLVNYFFTDIL